MYSTEDTWARYGGIDTGRTIYLVLAVSPGRFTDGVAGEYIPVTAVVSLGSRVAYCSKHSDRFFTLVKSVALSETK